MSDQSAPPVSGAIPYLMINDGKGKEAVAFYKEAFAAEEVAVMPAQDGKRLMHAHLRINGTPVMLSDEFPEHTGSKLGAPSGAMIHLAVTDADAWWKRAVDAGAKATLELADQFWGDRYGMVKDPFGHTWSIGAPKK